MAQKALYRKASDPEKYIVLHSTGGVYDPGEGEQNEVKKIVKQAEEDLKELFDRSDPALASGVKIAITEIM